MSRIDIPKLAATPPISGVGKDTRTAATSDQLRANDAARAAPQPASGGVRVEVSNPIEPGQPPVDSERVAEIRAALQDGSYPIVPTEIADAMIAARYMLGYEK
jgi:negative regulator of flagellin synthesis FlgM